MGWCGVDDLMILVVIWVSGGLNVLMMDKSYHVTVKPMQNKQSYWRRSCLTQYLLFIWGRVPHLALPPLLFHLLRVPIPL